MNSRNVGLCSVRVIATIMIIACHICQFYNYFLAWYLNVGVQIFLILSGYIFGKKEINNTRQWLLKRFKRIYLPYIILIIIITIIYFLFFPKFFDVNQLLIHIFCLQGIYGSYPNLYHLWYVTYILICYLFTPFLQFLFNRNIKKIYIACISFGILSIIYIISNKIEVIWLLSYIIGYYIGKLDIIEKITNRNLTVLVGLTLFSLCIKIIFIGMNFPFSIINIFVMLYGYFSHILLGLMIFCVIIFIEAQKNIISNFLSKRIISKLFYMIDNLSYEVYLVHQLFILGTFSVLSLSKNMFINYFLLVVLILGTACVLNTIVSVVINIKNNITIKFIKVN